MSTPWLLRLHGDRLRVSQEALKTLAEEISEEDASKLRRRSKRDLWDLVCDCLDYPEILRRICDSTYKAINDGAVLDTDRAAHELEMIFDRTLSFMRDARDLAQRFNGQGVLANLLERLSKAIDDTVHWRERLFVNWPWSDQPGPPFDPQRAQAAREAFAQGDVQDIEELIRELQGSDS